MYSGTGADPLAALERAFALTVECAPLRKKMKDKDMTSPDEAREAGVITAEEAAKLGDLHRAVREVIEVDSFDPSRFDTESVIPVKPEPVRAKSA